ncbi:MAG: adenylyl-sulfate reductase subunit alpha [Clostridium sp.]
MFNVKRIETDILIIGGGAAGLFAGTKEKSKAVLIVDKANIQRSGCLAAGINAINAFLDKEDSVDDYIDNISSEFNGIVREDLAKSIGENLYKVTKDIEDMGLTILKDKNGNYVRRGKRSIKINGENIKEILYKNVMKQKNINVLNNVNVIDYILKDERVIGAVGTGIKKNDIYIIYSKAVICATGGCSGLYKPAGGFSEGRNHGWYCPFNTGAGLAMGIRSGAEMTSFEIRFVALRIKDTVAPTGTIAQGIKGRMINKLKENYEERYEGQKTVRRLYGSIQETLRGNGPCYIKTEGIGADVEMELNKAYLNMAPIQVLYWKDNKIDIKKENVQIEGTEPYIVGGHSVCGYYVDTKRRTSLKGLYAIGDVAGGVGKKYVTGAFVEGEIGIKTASAELIENKIFLEEEEENKLVKKIEDVFLNGEKLKIEKLEEKMQRVMEEYCGGKEKKYGFTEDGLDRGEREIDDLIEKTKNIRIDNFHQFLFFRELIDRLYVCKVLINHMKERKERRIHVYNENLDYTEEKQEYLCYVNSIWKSGKIKMIRRDIVKRGEVFEYKNR